MQKSSEEMYRMIARFWAKKNFWLWRGSSLQYDLHCIIQYTIQYTIAMLLVPGFESFSDFEAKELINHRAFGDEVRVTAEEEEHRSILWKSDAYDRNMAGERSRIEQVWWIAGKSWPNSGHNAKIFSEYRIRSNGERLFRWPWCSRFSLSSPRWLMDTLTLFGRYFSVRCIRFRSKANGSSNGPTDDG